MYLEYFFYAQFSNISACRKYWLMAVNSSRNASLSCAITFGFPFIMWVIIQGLRVGRNSFTGGNRTASVSSRPAVAECGRILANFLLGDSARCAL